MCASIIKEERKQNKGGGGWWYRVAGRGNKLIQGLSPFWNQPGPQQLVPWPQGSFVSGMGRQTLLLSKMNKLTEKENCKVLCEWERTPPPSSPSLLAFVVKLVKAPLTVLQRLTVCPLPASASGAKHSWLQARAVALGSQPFCSARPFPMVGPWSPAEWGSGSRGGGRALRKCHSPPFPVFPPQSLLWGYRVSAIGLFPEEQMLTNNLKQWKMDLKRAVPKAA